MSAISDQGWYNLLRSKAVKFVPKEGFVSKTLHHAGCWKIEETSLRLKYGIGFNPEKDAKIE